jgi:hypothetical protein
VKIFDAKFLRCKVYHQIMKSSSVYVHDCSMVSPLALIFFGKQVAFFKK